MGFWDWLLGRQTTLEAAASANPHVFEVSVPTEVFGVEGVVDPTVAVGKVSRATARQVPAVKRARDLICGTLGTIPLTLVDPQNKITASAFLDQPEADVPRSVTFTRLFEDLLYDKVAWWENLTPGRFPGKGGVRRIAPGDVEIREGQVWLKQKVVTNAAQRLIRFDSPYGALLEDGARAIRTLLRLEAAAANYADDPMPQGYFSPVDNTDPLEDDEIAALLTAWKIARKKGATGYVPAALKYNDVQFSPEQLQMADARQHAVLEISRLTGIDAEDLSVSTTSRTYLNGQQKRQERINDVLGPLMTAVTDRLRMGDVTLPGFEVRPDFNGYLRADDKTRLENYKLGVDLGLYDLPMIAKREGLPAPATGQQQLSAKELAEIVQKVYLGVGTPEKPGLLTRDEARALLSSVGMALTAETRPALAAVPDRETA